MRAVLPLIFAAICAGQTCRPDQIAPSTHCCDGAMGTLHGSIFLRNRSDTKCVLEKVPEVTLLDKSGRNIPVKVEPNSELNRFGAGSPRFVLQPGRSAAVFLAIDPSFDENVCGTRMI